MKCHGCVNEGDDVFPLAGYMLCEECRTDGSIFLLAGIPQRDSEKEALPPQASNSEMVEYILITLGGKNNA